MDFPLWIAFVAASLPIHFAPGPNNVIALRNAAAFGLQTAVQAMIGRLPGYGLIFLVAGLGLAAALASQPAMFGALKVAGGFYLAWVGKTMALVVPKGAFEPHYASIAAEGLLRQEFLVAISNPKAILFATAFYMQFLSPASSHYAIRYAQMVAVSLSLEAVAGLIYCGVGAVIKIGPGSRRSLLWLSRGCGVLLSGIGLLLAVEGAGELV